MREVVVDDNDEVELVIIEAVARKSLLKQGTRWTIT